ncbi:helix-turn-helix domain-containing protein [Enterococcus sp. LJL90]
MIGRIVKWKRLRKGLSASEVIKQVFITRSHLSNIESGRRKPSPELLYSLSRMLDFSDKFTDIECSSKRRKVEKFKFLAFQRNEEKIGTVFKDLSKLTMTSSLHFSLEIFKAAGELNQCSNVDALKEICKTVILECDSKNEKQKILIQSCLFFLWSVDFNESNYVEALAWADIYIQYIHAENLEELAVMKLQECLIEWELGKQAELSTKLPKIKEEFSSVFQRAYLNEIWNFMYGRCLLYYGFTKEATHIFEKIIIQSKGTITVFPELILVTKILLHSYTDSLLINKTEIIVAIKKLTKRKKISFDLIPSLYIFATTLLQQNEENNLIEVLQMIRNLDIYPSKVQTNKDYFTILLHYHEGNYMLFVELCESYLENEKNIASNPYQAIDVSNRLMEYYQSKKMYKKASILGNLVIQIFNRYLRFRSFI